MGGSGLENVWGRGSGSGSRPGFGHCEEVNSAAVGESIGANIYIRLLEMY